ncbi:MAG: hypothetical protein QOC91_1149 [Solirubrobacteraceae bacterium]|nr:hypothetical protein [Solirubrobacteraceae bacterium]
MKIIPFPRPGDPRDEQTFDERIEWALSGETAGAEAESWRELRADVRTLSPPISPHFERELRERLQQRVASGSPRRRERRTPRAGLARARARLGFGRRPLLLAGAGACAALAVLALVIAAPWRQASSQVASQEVASQAVKAPAQVKAGFAGTAGSSAGAAVESPHNDQSAKGSAQQDSAVASPQPPGEASAGRLQQRAASITLAAAPPAVQSLADRVAQLAVREGGYVQRSQVQLQQGTAGEANLQLSLPSARLSAALAALGRLAPVRAESQSLQDITDQYNAARTRLADAVAERQALLRALSKAGTQGEIESLHARLALASGAITRARSAFQSVSRRASSSAVEVTVLGDTHAAGGGSSLSRALHDAGDVLKAALAVLIVALAVLVPLALLVALGAIGWRASRRRLRERALS